MVSQYPRVSPSAGLRISLSAGFRVCLSAGLRVCLLAGLMVSSGSGQLTWGDVPEESDTAGQASEPAARVSARLPAVKGVIERKSSSTSKAKGEINFDDLKFEIEKDAPFEEGMLTPEIRQLHGKKVKLRGYILPSTLFKETDIDRFVLVRDNQECCFGPGAALFDCVMIEMVPPRTTDFEVRPVTVEGKFEIDTKKYRYPEGIKGPSHFAIFRIKGLSVK